MKITTCKEITVRFNSVNHHAIQISFRHGPTRSQYLKVLSDPTHLQILFCDKDNDVVKEITYNFAHVLEYSCDDVHYERRTD